MARPDSSTAQRHGRAQERPAKRSRQDINAASGPRSTRPPPGKKPGSSSKLKTDRHNVKGPQAEREDHSIAETPGDDGPSVSEAEEVDIPIFERSSLALASNPLPPRSALAATLAKFTNLRRLDMSYMQPSPHQGEDDDDDDDDEGGSHANGLETLRFLDEAQRLAERDARKLRKSNPSAERRNTLADTLTWLNLAGNTALGSSTMPDGTKRSPEKVFQGLEHLKSLFVLNISSSSLASIPPRSTWLALSENLRALILSHNQLDDAALEKLPFLPNLNTLVLSNNRIKKLPRALPGQLPLLAKLSLSHNALEYGETEDDGDTDDDSDGSDAEDSNTSVDGNRRGSKSGRAKGSIAMPDFTMNTALREVRLSHNPRITRLPQHIKRWGQGASTQNRGLDLLDVGHCNLSWESVVDVLLTRSDSAAEREVEHSTSNDTGEKRKSSARHIGIKNLTLAGNRPIEDETGGDGYRSQIQEAMPSVVVLDNRRLIEKAKKPERGAAAKENTDRGTGVNSIAVSGRQAASTDVADRDESDQLRHTTDKKRKRGSRGGSSAKQSEDEKPIGESEAAEAAEVASDDEQVDGQKKKKKKKKKKNGKEEVAGPFVPAPESGKRAKRSGKTKKKADVPETLRDDADWLAHTRAAALSATAEDDEEEDGRKSKKGKRKGEVNAQDGEKGKSKGKLAEKLDKADKGGKKSKDAKRAGPAKAWDHVESVASSLAADDGGANGSAQSAPKKSASAGVAGIVEVKRKLQKQQQQHQQHQDQTQAPVKFTAASFSKAATGGDGIGEGGGDDAWGAGASAWD